MARVRRTTGYRRKGKSVKITSAPSFSKKPGSQGPVTKLGFKSRRSAKNFVKSRGPEMKKPSSSQKRSAKAAGASAIAGKSRRPGVNPSGAASYLKGKSKAKRSRMTKNATRGAIAVGAAGAGYGAYRGVKAYKARKASNAKVGARTSSPSRAQFGSRARKQGPTSSGRRSRRKGRRL